MPCDLEVLREVAQALDSHGETADKYNISGIVDEFQTALAAEPDYPARQTT